jgi:DNA-binding transcriptional MerR regulator
MGEIARHAGRSRQTLHAYALLGLICEAERTPGGHRRFSAGVLRRLEAIEAMKSDLTLAQIRDRLVPARGRRR